MRVKFGFEVNELLSFVASFKTQKFSRNLKAEECEKLRKKKVQQNQNGKNSNENEKIMRKLDMDFQVKSSKKERKNYNSESSFT